MFAQDMPLLLRPRRPVSTAEIGAIGKERRSGGKRRKACRPIDERVEIGKALHYTTRALLAPFPVWPPCCRFSLQG
jgi:hypothetical protein